MLEWDLLDEKNFFKQVVASRTYSVCLFVQWEPQHAGLSCEQYQSWKRENDPEYQRQGLAGYLRDNGISEPDMHMHAHTFID